MSRAQDWIAERVIDLLTALAADDHLLGPQDGEVLGQVGLFNRAVAVSGSLRLSHAGAPQTGWVLIDSAWGSLDTLEIEYDLARALRQLLVRRLSVLAAGVLALVVWLHVLPWSVFVVTVLLATAMLGVAVRNEHDAHERYRATAIHLAKLMKVLPQTGSQPKAR